MNKHIIRIISIIVLIIFTANSSAASQQENILPIPRCSLTDLLDR